MSKPTIELVIKNNNKIEILKKNLGMEWNWKHNISETGRHHERDSKGIILTINAYTKKKSEKYQ